MLNLTINFIIFYLIIKILFIYYHVKNLNTQIILQFRNSTVFPKTRARKKIIKRSRYIIQIDHSYTLTISIKRETYI